MSWEEAIQMAGSDKVYDLSTLEAESAIQLFKSKIDQQKLDQAMEDLKLATQVNEDNAKKLANVLGIINTIVGIGKIIIA